MSLTLLQGYSSEEDEGREESELPEDFVGEISEDDLVLDRPRASYSTPYIFTTPIVAAESGLPSALDAFSEVPGPPQFLNNSAEVNASTSDVDHSAGRSSRWKVRKDKKDFPAGAVVHAKPQLVGIQDRVRSDVESNQSSNRQDDIKRAPIATPPSAGDAAELLRICLQCGVPKTFSTGKGIVCPICNDRAMAEKDSKKKGSVIKDKEKYKRMKGQSSHATWKTDTEMVLRQHFD